MVTILIMQVADIDEIEREVVGDEVHLTMKTATPIKAFARLKARLKTLLTFPVKKWEIREMKRAERGIWSTYHIQMVLPLRANKDTVADTLKNMFGERNVVIGDRRVSIFGR